MQRLCNQQLRRYLVSTLKDIVPKADADDLAETVICLSYGFWLQFAHRPAEFDVARARRMALAVIDARIRAALQHTLLPDLTVIGAEPLRRKTGTTSI